MEFMFIHTRLIGFRQSPPWGAILKRNESTFPRGAGGYRLSALQEDCRQHVNRDLYQKFLRF